MKNIHTDALICGFEIDFQLCTIKTNRPLDRYLYSDIKDLIYNYPMFPFPLYGDDDGNICLIDGWKIESCNG